MGKNAMQTKQWLDECCGEFSPSRQMVEKWIGEFKRGHTNKNDMVLDDRKVKLRELA